MTCSRAPSAVIRLILLIGLFYPAACPTASSAAGAQGKIVGENYVNLRSGPDLSSPAVAVVKQGDTLTIEAEEKGWYRVVLANGVRGYIHKPLVDFVADIEPAQEPPPTPTMPKAKDSKIESLPAASIKPTAPKQRENWEWIVTLVCCFFLGWILGGNYYLRRDHTRRHKLHL